MTGPGATSGEASQRQLRNEAAAVLVGRLITLAQLTAATATLRRQVRHPGALVSGVAAIEGQSLWAARRIWRTRRVRDRAAGWSDVAAGTSALAIEAASWRSRDLPPDPRWSLPFAVVVSAWLPFELEPADLTAAGGTWLAAYVAAIRSRSRFRTGGSVRGQWLNELFAPPTCTFFSRRFASQLRTQAEQLDLARARSVDQADQLAREEERNRQYRVAHDSAVQVLEAVAGAWDVDQQMLAERIDFEIRRLERVLAGGTLTDGGSLAVALTALAVGLGRSGLQVDTVVDRLVGSPQPSVVAALCEAAQEALANVAKHAGVDRAVVGAVEAGGGFEVTVRDEGRGFDVAAPRAGFGLTHSVSRRMEAVGGRVEIQSRPGGGTTVRLWAPA